MLLRDTEEGRASFRERNRRKRERGMEKHKCKLCFRSFANGRALGGHMRSHMMNLYVPPKQQPERQVEEEIFNGVHYQLDGGGQETDSAARSSSPSSSEEEENEERESSLLCYGLRENPKKSIKLVDPEFSFVGSAPVQDRESESESSKNPARRRSNRIRKSEYAESHMNPKEPAMKKVRPGKLFIGPESSWPEPEPVSSISDTTTEEDVAFCLMMMKRDKWMREKEDEDEGEDHDDEEEEGEGDDYQTDESNELKQRKIKGKYKCETCNKVFKSYQALGGHRASHKKNRIILNNNNNVSISIHEKSEVDARSASVAVVEEKIHECPVCFRVFSSGQALGGHKRSHVTGSSSMIPAKRPPTTNLIDLNLPAPIDDDEFSQIELSAVSDAEFVNPIRH